MVDRFIHMWQTKKKQGNDKIQGCGSSEEVGQDVIREGQHRGFENIGNILFPKWDDRFLSVYYF